VTYTQDLVNCNGASVSIISSKSCYLPITALRESPYNLAWGASVKAYVLAQNNYGISTSSTVGNGAIILTNPDAPINFEEDLDLKSATSIALQWDEGLINGGTIVQDYQVSFDQGIDDFIVLETNIIASTYVVTGLTPGVTYQFSVQARNAFGLSDDSEILTILSGYVSATPIAPTSSVAADQVILNWTEPYDNGATIISYIVTIKDSLGVFQTELTSCDGSDTQIVVD
jgi:hypothetical protein